MKKKSSAKGPRVTVTSAELAERVKSLRRDLRMSQEEFARKLYVGRTQVVSWESGKRDKPSVKKLLEMAALARQIVDARWFLKAGGVDAELIRVLFQKEQKEIELQAKSLSQLGSVETREATILRIIDDFRIGQDGAPVPQFGGELRISIQAAGRSGSTVGVVVQRRFTDFVRSDAFPEQFGPRDLVLVDQTQIDPKEFIECHRHRMAAVLLPRSPDRISVPLVIEPVHPVEAAKRARMKKYDPAIDEAEEKFRQEHEDPLAFELGEKEQKEFESKLGEEQMSQPILLFGKIVEQSAGGEGSVEWNEPHQLRRLALLLPNNWSIPLTDWMNDRSPRDIGARAMLLEGARIFGSVVGWIFAFRASEDAKDASGL